MEFLFHAKYLGEVAHFMKTSEHNVIVDLKSNGSLRRCSFPIATKDGELMTHRLDRLLKGKISHSCEDGVPKSDVHFVGIVWHRPFNLLNEVMRDRRALQIKLRRLCYTDPLIDIPLPYVSMSATSNIVSMTLQSELALREMLKKQIKKYEQSVH